MAARSKIMPIIIEEISTKELLELFGGSKCPSEETHRWDDDFGLGSICFCSKWQIIELINYESFWAIDITGRRQVFDRSEI